MYLLEAVRKLPLFPFLPRDTELRRCNWGGFLVFGTQDCRGNFSNLDAIFLFFNVASLSASCVHGAFEGLAIMHSWLINIGEVPTFLFCYWCSLALAVKVEPEGMACFTHLKAENTEETNPPNLAVPVWFLRMCSVHETCFLGWLVLS